MYARFLIVCVTFRAISQSLDVWFCRTIFLLSILAMRRRIRGILMSGKQFSLDSRMDLMTGDQTQSKSTTDKTDFDKLEENCK